MHSTKLPWHGTICNQGDCYHWWNTTRTIIDFDQTALNYIPVFHWIMGQVGTNIIEVVSKDDKKLIDHLNWFILLIPHNKFPPPWHVTKTLGQMNIQWGIILKESFFHILRKRSALKLSSDQPALLILTTSRHSAFTAATKLMSCLYHRTVQIDCSH